MATAEQVQAAQAMALQYVAARPRTAHEVQQKLARNGVAEAVIDQVLARLHAHGVLDDAAYTHAYLASRLAGRGYGPQRLRRELHQRGISRALVEEAIPRAVPSEEVLAAARVHAAKRWQRLRRVGDLSKRRQKLFAFLCRRGFAAVLAQQVIAELVEGPGGSAEESPFP